jgi:hypothetical protein
VPLCLRSDLGVAEWDSINLNVAVYLCNQQIYRPATQARGAVDFETITNARPLRVILPLCDPADRRVTDWLRRTEKNLRLKSTRTLDVSMSEAGTKPRIEKYVIHEFVPKPPMSAVIRRSAGIDSTLEQQKPWQTALK